MPRGRPFTSDQKPHAGPGRPKVPSDFKAACKAFSPQAFERLRQEVAENGDHWFKALELLVAYGEGKPAQGVEVTGADGGPLEVVIRTVADEG